MFIRSDNYFNIRLEFIDEIDQEQYVYSSTHQTNKKSSEYTYERKMDEEKAVHNYFQGEIFPIKGMIL